MSDENDDNNNPSPAGANGRDSTGKFAKGNTAGKGNPHQQKVQAFKAAILKAVTEDDVTAIVKKAIEQAKDGDRSARDFIFDRLLGRPVQTVEADVTTNQLSPAEARARVGEFFGIKLEK